mgnify:CR=1 FL=1
MPLTGVCGMAATLPSFQGGKTVSLSSGYAVAAITGPPGSSNAHPVPMIDIGSAPVAPKPTRADLLLELAEARQAFLEAEADLDYTSDSEFCHSVDVGGGPVSLGQPSPSTARESPSTGVYSPPLPTTTSTTTRYPVDISLAFDSVYMPCVSWASAEAAVGLSRTRPAVPPPITALLSAPAETIATDTVPSSITVADIHQSRVLQRSDELCVTGGRTAGIACGVSRGLKSMRCSSSLPPVLTTVRDGKGSSRITDGASSIHAHRDHHGLGGDDYPADVHTARSSASAHSVPTHTLPVSTGQPGVGQGGNGQSSYSGDPHGQGRYEYSADDYAARNSAAANFVPTPTLPRPTEQSGVGQGENDHSPHSSVIAHRIDSALPTHRQKLHGRSTSAAGAGAQRCVKSILGWCFYGEIWDVTAYGCGPVGRHWGFYN